MSRDYTESDEEFVYRVRYDYSAINPSWPDRYKGPYTKRSVAKGIVTAHNNRSNMAYSRGYSHAVLQRAPIESWEDVPDEPKR